MAAARQRTAWLAVAAFVGVGVFYAAANRPARCQGGDVMNIATMLLKDADPSLLPRDFAFGDPRYYRTYLPFYRAALAAASRAAGGPLAAHKLLLLFAVPAYLTAMFFFLRALTGSGLVSFAAALASMTVRGSEHYPWGLGPLWTALPRSLYLPLFPTFFWALLRTQGRPRLRLALFAALGASFNLHPQSAAVCALGMLAYIFYTEGLTRSTGKQAAALALAAALLAAPSAALYAREQTKAALTPDEAAQVNRILRARFPFLYLDAGAFGLSCIGGWLWLASALGAAIKARAGGLDRRDGGLLAAGLAALGLALLCAAATPWIAARLHIPRPLPYALRWAKFIFLIHYVFLAHLACGLLRLKRARPAAHAAGVLLVAWMFADAGDQAAGAWQDARRPPAGDEAAVLDLAAWARAHTSKDALFHFDNRRFRLEARRSLTVCWKDGGLFWHSDLRKLLEWWRRLERARAAQAAGAGAARRLAEEWGADYLVLPAAGPRPRRPAAYANARYVVYRVRGDAG